MEEEILYEKKYETSKRGYNLWGEPVDIIGERLVRFLDDGSLGEQYLYNKVGYTPKNGLPFVSLKANISLRV